VTPMEDPAMAEIEALVASTEDDGDDDGPFEDTDEKEKPKKSSGRRRVGKAKEPKEPKEQTVEELEASELISSKTLPKVAQNVKTLDDLYSKYGIGDDPDFKIQVWRTWPKTYPGGKKADGFYDTWEMPLSYEQIQTEYGGGAYRITVMGPHPSQPNRQKHYDSIAISLAGDPKYSRVPRALQGQEGAESTTPAAFPLPQPMMQTQESPKLAEAALNMIENVAKREREDRHRTEEQASVRLTEARGMVEPLVEAERRRADDILAAERRLNEHREQAAQERLEQERQARMEERQRAEQAQNSRGSFADELRAMKDSGLLGRDDGVAREMLKQVLEKHRSELDTIQAQHVSLVESIRTGHAAEVLAVRDAHRREMEAEREASRSREARIEERLSSEREERRRDQERARQTLEERDLQWKDRVGQQEQILKTSWEARHSSLVSTHENRVQWLQGEIDRLKQDNYDYRQKRDEMGDPIAQITKMAELQHVMREAIGVTATAAPATSAGGIGLSGGEDWKATLAEGAMERLPDIMQGIFGGGVAQQQIQQPQYTLGQIVPTPQGEMMVVQGPDGQMQFAPRAAVEAHQRALAAAPSGGGLLAPGAKSKPKKKPARLSISAVQNFAEGLPRRRPAWEGGGMDEEESTTPPAPPRMTSRRSAPAEATAEPLELSSAERQGIQMVAKLVHDAVNQAEEPEEFVARVIGQYDPGMLRQIIGQYTTDQIIQAIRQLQPHSAGATPAGQRFVRDAFGQLRNALAQ